MNKKIFPILPATFRPPQTTTKQTLLGIPSGLDGIRATLAHMHTFVSEYKTNQTVRELALKLTRNLPQKDFKAEIQALFNYVQNHIRYVRDVAGVETIQTPVKTLEYGQGDCDDKSVLLAALLESVGHLTRFHAMGFRAQHISHVLLEVKTDNEWLSLDTTEPNMMGWAPPGIRHSIYKRN